MGSRRVDRGLASLVGIAGIALALAAPANAQPAGDEIEIETDFDTDDKPAEDKPAEDKPAEDKPAEDKPAEDKPAADKPADAQPADAPAAADPPKEEPAPVVKDPRAARRWMWTGKQLVRKGDYRTRRNKPDEARVQYENAITAFQKALELGDDINVMYDLADVEDKLGKHDEAAKHWRQLIKAEGARPDIVKKATARYEEVTLKIGLVTLNVTPEGATISLAGVELGKAPLPEPLILLPGTYAFSIAADGFEPLDIEHKVEAGSESERGIELEPIKIVVEAPPVVDEEPIPLPPPPPPPSRLPLYIGGGAAVALAVTATVTGILAVGQHGTFTAADSSAGERQDARDKGKRLALITDGATLGALIAGGFTAYWYLYKYKPALQDRGRERATAKVGVAPWVQPGADPSGGLVLSGSF